ncbi:MAG: adenylate/guanylate cyclase domain-containing protein [Leptolyngbyaceae cyanobacterium]
MGRPLFKSNRSANRKRSVDPQANERNPGSDHEPLSNPQWRDQAIYSLLNPLTATNLKPVEFQQVGPLSRWLGHVSIRWVITVPFIVQMVVAASAVGYLSFRHGQATAGALLEQWQTEMGDRVRQQLDEALQAPHDIAQLNQQAYELGQLDLQNVEQIQHYFHQQMVLANFVGQIHFTSIDGRVVAVERHEDGSVSEGPLTLPSVRDRVAVETGQSIWSNIYQRTDQPDHHAMSARYPIYQDPDNPDTFVGTLGVEFMLLPMNQFLANLTTDAPGQIFIMERATGRLVASSDATLPFTRVDGETIQIRAIASEHPLIRETAAYLANDLDGFNFTSRPQSIQTRIGGDRHYLRLVPWQDSQGLDWLIVAVIPKAATIAQISHNTVITLILCAFALAIAIATSIRSAQWLIQPIVFLNNAAKNLAGGAWNQTFVLQRSDEVGQLAQSFNDMARQLRHSFRDLEQQKDSFARFFPPEYLNVLDKPNIHSVRLGDHVSREMPVMFSDIRGFTSLSESMTPQETFSFVNDYLAEVAPAVRMHDGLIIKFLGDGTMAVFPDSADSAVNAGIATFQALKIYNRRRLSQGDIPIHIGIGLHVGYMMVGIVGEQNRMQADAISDTVNLTGRLEGLTKFYGVSFLISGQVVENLSHSSHYQLRFLGEAVVKGRREPIDIYEVVDVEDESDRHLKQETLADFKAGIQAYRDGNLTIAKAAFERVIAIHPQDQPARHFLEHTEKHLVMGIPGDWTGIWRFTTK